MDKHPKFHSPYDAPMWESISREQMQLQCDEGGTFYYPPGPACPESLSMQTTWKPVSGRARILAWTVFHRKYLPEYPPPTLVVAVQLEEGPIMVSNMAYAERDRLRIDAPARMIYVDHANGYKIPSFTLVEAE